MKKLCSLLPILALVIGILSSCSTQKPEPLVFGKFATTYKSGNIDASAQPKFGKLRGFLNRNQAEKNTGLYLLEAFDPEKIPVLFVHGLLDDIRTWETMVAALKTDPEITERFQFWFYSYPTATPVIPSSSIMKWHLDRAVSTVESEFDISMKRRLMVVGHSMGGILSKSLVSDTDDILWDAAFTEPIENFDLTDRQRTHLANAFRYKSRPYVNSVTFIASPQRGSYLASSFIGKIGSGLSSRPHIVDELVEALLSKNKERLKPEFADFVAHNINSISTLRPDAPVTNVLADLPIDEGVTFHTIAGIKSKNKDEEKTREIGDGVVPLWSTELPGARCEIGIISGHGAHRHPFASQLVNGILKAHVGLKSEEEIIADLETMQLPLSRYNDDGFPLNIIRKLYDSRGQIKNSDRKTPHEHGTKTGN